MRAKFGDHVLNGEGQPVAGASVYIYQVGTTTPITETIYETDDTVGNATLTNPLTTSSTGRFDFYLTEEKRVDLYITAPNLTARTVTVDVLELTSTSSIVVKSAGTAVSTRPAINFVSGATVADDAVNNEVDITISAGATLADAAPPAIGASGSVGVSTEAAREDHTHSGAAYQALSGLAFVRKTADESIASSTVLQDDDDLFFSVAANETWIFSGLLRMFAATAADTKLTFVGPTGAAGVFSALGPDSAATSVTAQVDFSRRSLSDVHIIGGNGSFSTNVQIQGIVRNGATAGTLKLQWAQNVSDATASQLLTDSFLEARKVA